MDSKWRGAKGGKVVGGGKGAGKVENSPTTQARVSKAGSGMALNVWE